MVVCVGNLSELWRNCHTLLGNCKGGWDGGLHVSVSLMFQQPVHVLCLYV